MACRSIDLEVTPNPRTREENQERAFIAASRRKDRSLDARVESANRASALHKQRTGKGLLITRDIVEKEAMYEEVDDRYQEKINRMLQAQNLQIQDQFHHHVLAALAVRPPPNQAHQNLQQRRAANLTPRASMNGGIRKMSLDLSGMRGSLCEGMNASPASSPVGVTQSYMMSPTYDGSTPSSYPEVVPASTGQIPSYLTHTAHAGPGWQSQALGPPHFRSPWGGFQQIPTRAGDMGTPARHPFRDRMGSAPVIPVHALASASASASAGPGPLARTMSQHTRVRSEPQGFPSGTTSPQVEIAPSEPLPTPDLCPSPSTPHSPTSSSRNTEAMGLESLSKDGDSVSFSHEGLDPDFAEFSQFAFGLGNAPQLAEGDFRFDDLVTLDEFSITA
ncbi:hypothetical protein EYZ11_002198 [Aspergillus tanneri]|uniref:Uncharacterized protein n=1 Tax=Aspergillus tanneri TaxID=1220188 RepID=A0A4S3JTE7_9EURO|nr:uncharacterized protein ATNIH1004_008952 [Aspergillus tanneri]KAA8644745.1 hypothetical protein ATNIH1004_008952 [Aspergillus tanneri]THC98337.1 hypothetical protein EYZ11_002198 [Aspergillus tanneri]